MTDLIRRLVSGDKARFKDGEIDVDLDLVYITDQVIVMGYPASGLEALYRNRREDAKRFLEHRHGKNFWVFNFCPAAENCYPASVFDGRVSRYPFPDHHVPPLAVLPLVAREMRAWLGGSSVRVAVLHCKAGKGRSGTMACAYLLTSHVRPGSPQVERTETTREQATWKAEQIIDSMPSDELVGPELHGDDNVPQAGSSSSFTQLRTGTQPNSEQAEQSPRTAYVSPNEATVFPFPRAKARGPPGLWSLGPAASGRAASKVRLTQIVVRMRELSGAKAHLVRAANAVIERTSYAKTASAGRGQVWASLARYDDRLVSGLERWEAHTRDEAGDMGRRRPGSAHMGDESISDVFTDDRWDNLKAKMVRTFARLGMVGKDTVQKEDTEADGKVTARTLRPLTDDHWDAVQVQIQENGEAQVGGEIVRDVEPEKISIREDTQVLNEDDAVVLNADREVRVKLYMGQVFMGWFWFVPAFHMPQMGLIADRSATLTLKRKEFDFPIGVGKYIVDVQVLLEWLPGNSGATVPSRQSWIKRKGVRAGGLSCNNGSCHCHCCRTGGDQAGS